MKLPKMALAGLHLVGNASLLLLAYYWLGMGESDGLHLVLSAAVILFVALAALWLHSTSLVLFRKQASLLTAVSRALRSLPPLFLLGILVLLIYLALQYSASSFGHQAFNIGSYGTMKLRRPVEPTKVLQAFQIFIWLMRWFVVPVFALPLAANIANQGWSGFNLSAFQGSKKVLFWIEAGLLLLVAIYVPLRLFFWIPKMSSFSLELASVIARIGLGYLLFTAGLLAVEYFTASGKPRVTQLSTAASP